jgi:transposase
VVMNKFLTSEEQKELEKRHKKENGRRTADRIKAVLMSNDGWSFREISKILMIDEETVSKHVHEYQESQKLEIESGGSHCKLSDYQIEELNEYLVEHTYAKASEICEYVNATYGISYSVQGMTSWLRNHGFSYKKPQPTPSKADPEKQAKFVEEYKNLQKKTPEDEPIMFLDAVHPTMATKISYGWIKKGEDKLINTTASRTRMNIVGALNLETMEVHAQDYATVNSESMENYFAFLREKYPKNNKIHIILDQGPYNKSEETRKAARKYNIELHFLPPYSPNLNPIERLWKVMNEYVRNNRFFTSAQEFRESIRNFFDYTWKNISKTMVDRINDNFHISSKSNFST